jgi:hypothetical protein
VAVYKRKDRETWFARLSGPDGRLVQEGRRGGPPRRPTRNGLRERGSHAGHIRRGSVYVAASTHPVLTAAGYCRRRGRRTGAGDGRPQAGGVAWGGLRGVVGPSRRRVMLGTTPGRAPADRGHAPPR